MNLSYFYCTSCGYEDMDIFAAFIHQTASGSILEESTTQEIYFRKTVVF